MKAHLTLTLALLLICSGAALAQTPAEETVCDNETGAAFGLCNAYCEAMDCESDSPQASATACTKVRTKFQNIAGHDLPCEAVVCPCLSAPAFNWFLGGADYCEEVPGQSAFLVNGPEYIFAHPLECGYVHTDVGSNNFTLPVSPAELAACLQAMHDATASRGLTCQ